MKRRKQYHNQHLIKRLCALIRLTLLIKNFLISLGLKCVCLQSLFSCQNPYLRTATLVNPTEDEIIQEAAEEAISAEYDMEVKIYYDEARKRAEGLQQRLALPLFWENQKINFVLAFFGYACSH